ncbi:OmpA family protein [Roseibacterium sp. SDUM158016]|jgi:outer membrane protein OmpA-like peptidoglycan-associated protein|uniref:OmpA family protein n=1 Tax=Roseicyclus sediminis TaxID=2980997 RepID=UPI0021CFE1A0|nr:OmpA family protein [Roseibacterium sp. SDUM158016]MCU4655185.1 OmpA family protein [Roseibacterium sp. SDUM158016]
MRITTSIASPTPLRRRIATGGLALGLVLGLAGCEDLFDASQPLGAHLDEGGFGNPTMTNIMLHNGELSYAEVLGRRFAETVPTTINFAFNSAVLDEQARAILREQAAFIRHFPEVRFTVYGHTDLVGSNAYNQRLGLRRARAAVDYIVSQGVERSRLQAMVSLGETQPVVATETEERRNRRTVTEVTGFVQTHPMVLDGEYAQIVYRTYVSGASGSQGGAGDGSGAGVVAP